MRGMSVNAAPSASERRRWRLLAVAVVALGGVGVWLLPSPVPPAPPEPQQPVIGTRERPLRLPRVSSDLGVGATRAAEVQPSDTEVPDEEPLAPPTWEQLVRCEGEQCRYNWPLDGVAALASLGNWTFDRPDDLKDPNTRLTMSTVALGFKRPVILEIEDVPVVGPSEARCCDIMYTRMEQEIAAMPSELIEELSARARIGPQEMAAVWFAKLAEEQGATVRVYALEHVLDEVGEPTGFERGEELAWGW
jgi:hypothetical protein